MKSSQSKYCLLQTSCPDEEFPTTCEDLAGFWDMVSIQVEDIKQSLQEIETLRANNWQEVSILFYSPSSVLRFRNNNDICIVMHLFVVDSNTYSAQF